ncbi:hypothetical protein CPB83DRAFT_851624 [Crepidotus variabilis]|uniref:Uncharacterized protein n=1 Tax=Crepidotus variabilis TaxID=179855 RepID=A0A9P6JR17_9AGAR|nr:hypothetical protein CPB83DRAFT_851624 [Crepidotus variabilis]
MAEEDSLSNLEQVVLIVTRLLVFWTGLYVWEVLTSLWYEIGFVSGTRVFHWHLVPYIVSRYSQLIGLISLLYLSNSTRQGNCEAAYLLSFFLELSVLAASITFALRTIAIWMNRVVTICLWGMVVVYAVLVVLSTAMNKSGNYSGRCSYVNPRRAYSIVTIIRVYSMIFDGVVLLLNIYKLRTSFKFGVHRRLFRLLFTQGLIYFIIAFLSNLVAVVFLLSTSNPFLGLTVTESASVLTVVAACRSVRHLDQSMIQGTRTQYALTTISTGPPQVSESTTHPTNITTAQKTNENVI